VQNQLFISREVSNMQTFNTKAAELEQALTGYHTFQVAPECGNNVFIQVWNQNDVSASAPGAQNEHPKKTADEKKGSHNDHPNNDPEEIDGPPELYEVHEGHTFDVNPGCGEEVLIRVYNTSDPEKARQKAERYLKQHAQDLLEWGQLDLTAAAADILHHHGMELRRVNGSR